MRLGLGIDGKNIFKILSRWGAEIRSTFFLGDEDFEPMVWTWNLSDLSTSTAGVTFSDLQILIARYIHIGKLCLFDTQFNVLPSGDHVDLYMPTPPPIPEWDGVGGRSAQMFGLISPVRWAAIFGAINLRVPPCISFAGTNDLRFRVLPTLYGGAGNLAIYSAAGAQVTTYTLQGFYFTQKPVER